MAAAYLRTIGSAQQTYRARNGRHATFTQLVRDGLLDDRFRHDSPEVDGYKFKMGINTVNAEDRPSYEVNADPIDAIKHPRHFYVSSQSPGVRVRQGAQAGPSDELVR